MKIIEPTLTWRYDPGRRASTDYIILHHAAADGSVEDVHRYHRDTNGWSGIAYHFYVRKDGSIYRGRPETWKGGHTQGYNNVSIGVCFEGNFQNETMGEAQLRSGQWLIDYLRNKFPRAAVVQHKDLNATACAGANFPMDKITGETGDSTPDELSTWAESAAEKALARGIIQGDGNGNYGWQKPVTLERLFVFFDRLGLLD